MTDETFDHRIKALIEQFLPDEFPERKYQIEGMGILTISREDIRGEAEQGYWVTFDDYTDTDEIGNPMVRNFEVTVQGELKETLFARAYLETPPPELGLDQRIPILTGDHWENPENQHGTLLDILEKFRSNGMEVSANSFTGVRFIG